MRYQSIHEVPRAWRRLSGTPLSLDQIEALLDEAETADAEFAVAFGQAKRDFVESHTVRNGQWVAKKGGVE